MNPPITALRAIALAAFFCMFFGTCGVTSSVVAIDERAQVAPTTLPVGARVDGELQIATDSFSVAMMDAQASVPQRKLIAAGNLLASALLLVAAFMLMRRSPNAVWWTTQACIANALHAFARGSTNAWHMHTHAAELGRAFDRAAHAVAQTHGADAASASIVRGMDLMNGGAVAVLVVMLIEVGLYALVARRMSKGDVATALVVMNAQE